MKEQARAFWSDDRAAVAPTVTLALVGLIAAGGLAFDYARMATLDTELQQAADQAALAAASQLDGEAGARNRATSAAQNLVSNLTLFANDGSGTAISIETPVYYAGYDPATGTKSPVATGDADANYVEVSVVARTANYALTPIVALFSAEMDANAFAGIGSAICNVPPVMMCNPAEPVGNTNPNVAFSVPAGTGIRLVTGTADAPGDFGFLLTGYGTGATNLARALGYGTPPGECAPITGVTTEPGDKQAVRAALNTRFDMSEAGLSCPTGGTCAPSRNTRKDLVRGAQCGSGPQGWQEAANPYRAPSPTTPLDGTNDPDIMGYPRDMCHAVSVDGQCGPGGTASRVGNGIWDRDAYFRVNYGWNNATWRSQTGLTDSASRYDVYEWELNHTSTADMTQADSGTPTLNGYSYPVCRAPGVTPGTTTPDRRRLSVAVINCEAEGVNGRTPNIDVLEWVDIFLVEPSYARGSGPNARTEDGDIYVEVIGETLAGGAGAVAGQVIRRDVPRLIE